MKFLSQIRRASPICSTQFINKELQIEDNCTITEIIRRGLRLHDISMESISEEEIGVSVGPDGSTYCFVPIGTNFCGEHETFFLFQDEGDL